LPTIKALLQSSRPADAISEELLEIIGFEDIELVTDIMQHQAEVANLVRRPVSVFFLKLPSS
jgi:hypothetical protein